MYSHSVRNLFVASLPAPRSSSVASWNGKVVGSSHFPAFDYHWLWGPHIPQHLWRITHTHTHTHTHTQKFHRSSRCHLKLTVFLSSSLSHAAVIHSNLKWHPVGHDCLVFLVALLPPVRHGAFFGLAGRNNLRPSFPYPNNGPLQLMRCHHSVARMSTSGR